MARYCARPLIHPAGCDCAVWPHHVGGEIRSIHTTTKGTSVSHDPNGGRPPSTRTQPLPDPFAKPDMVNHPSHYMHPSGIECITVSRLCHGDLSAVIQYIWRYASKNGHEDLRKAQWYINDILANAMPVGPPHKVTQLLHQVVATDDDPIRAELLSYIADGRLDWCGNRIAVITGDQK